MVSRKNQRKKKDKKEPKKHKRKRELEKARKKERRQRRKRKYDSSSSSSDEDVFQESSSSSDSEGEAPATYHPKGSTQKPKKRKIRKKILKTKTLRTGKSRKKSRRGSRKKKGKNVEKHVIVRDEDEDSLFAAVRNPNTALDDLASDLADDYGESHEEAMSQLISFIFHSAGCTTAKFSKEDVAEPEYATFIQQFIDIYPEASDYPIISNHENFHNFCDNFSEFWDLVLTKMGDHLADKFFLEYLKCWLTTLSFSNHRAFRHTATVILFQFVDSLISIIKKDLRPELKRLKKMKKKWEGAQDETGVEQNEKLRDSCRMKIKKFENMIQEIYSAVFSHRYKDVVCDIRALCLVSLYRWIKKSKKMFFDDHHIKYLGWGLHDKDPSVRLKCLEILTRLYGKKDYHQRLVRFTSKFIGRIVEMASGDLNVKVAVEGIKLATILLENELLSGEHNRDMYIAEIESLLFDISKPIRFYASEFIYANMEQRKIKKRLKKMKKRKKKDSAVDLDDILRFMRRNYKQTPLVAHYVVENFWGVMKDDLTNWEVYQEILLEEEDDDDDDVDMDRDEADKTLCLNLLNAVILKVNNALDLPGSPDDRGIRMPASRTRAIKNFEIEDFKKDYSQHFIPIFSQVLKKYSTNHVQVIPVIEICGYFDMKVFDDNEIHFNEIFKLMKELFWKYNEKIVIKSLAKTIQKYVENEDYSKHSEASGVYKEIVMELLKKLRESINRCIESEDEDDEGVFIEVEIGLRKISEFIKILDINMAELVNDMKKILDAKLKNANLSPQIVITIIEIFMVYFSWRITELQRDSDDAEEKKALATRVSNESNRFFGQLVNLMNEAKEYEVRKTALFALCDLFVYFSECNVEQIEELNTMTLMENDVRTIIGFFKLAMKEEGDKMDIDDDSDSDASSGSSSDEDGPIQRRRKRKKRKKKRKKRKERKRKKKEERNMDVSPHSYEQQRIIAGLLKAMTKSEVNSDLASTILSNFVLYDKRVTRAVKSVYQAVKSDPNIAIWNVEFKALKELYSMYVIDENEANYKKFEKLAKRLGRSHFFGLKGDDLEADRLQISALLRNSIEYVFDDPDDRLKFLPPLKVYMERLDLKNLQEIESYLNDRISSLQAQPEDKEGDLDSFKLILKEFKKKRGGGRDKKKKKKKKIGESDEDVDISDFSDDDGDVVMKDKVKKLPPVIPVTVDSEAATMREEEKKDDDKMDLSEDEDLDLTQLEPTQPDEDKTLPKSMDLSTLEMDDDDEIELFKESDQEKKEVKEKKKKKKKSKKKRKREVETISDSESDDDDDEEKSPKRKKRKKK